jgi:hypothetical protein
MIIIGIFLVVRLGIFCWPLFTLAIHAVPFFVGTTAGIDSLQAGTGPFGALVVGFVAGGFVLVAGQHAISAIGPLFAVPAAGAGYDSAFGLAHVGVPSGCVAGGIRRV